MAPDWITVVVTHRLDKVRIADRVIVLDQGRIRDQGSHELIATEGSLLGELDPSAKIAEHHGHRASSRGRASRRGPASPSIPRSTMRRTKQLLRSRLGDLPIGGALAAWRGERLSARVLPQSWLLV